MTKALRTAPAAIVAGVALVLRIDPSVPSTGAARIEGESYERDTIFALSAAIPRRI
jgi:hypothetical protein